MITFSTDNRRNMMDYHLVFFKVDGEVRSYINLTQEQQAQANKIYPVTFEARNFESRELTDHAAEIAALREALQKIADMDGESFPSAFAKCVDVAREALEGATK